VCLRKSPVRTSKLLAANRRNSQKSTGPRTVAGKARACLNALKHGERACRLAEKLMACGDLGGARLHARMWREIEGVFGVTCREEARQAERLANAIYALLRRVERLRTRPECPLFSARLGPRILRLFRICVTDPTRRIGLCYWVQRKGYWNRDRVMAAAFIPETMAFEPPLGWQLETRLRRRLYRMRRPGLWERIAYGLAGAEGSGQNDESRNQKVEIGNQNGENEGQEGESAKPKAEMRKRGCGSAGRMAAGGRECQGRPRPDLIRTLNANGGRWWREDAVRSP